MTTFRITYRDECSSPVVAEYLQTSTSIAVNKAFVSPGRVEIRSSAGDVFRLQHNTEFVVRETEEGVQPVIHGEVFGIIAASWMKYTTSCYSCKSHASAPLHLLVRPSTEEENTDEYMLLLGDMVVHDFDERGCHFVICAMEEGDKVYISYDPEIHSGKGRYSARTERMSDDDWSYAQSEYLDNRRWIECNRSVVPV